MAENSATLPEHVKAQIREQDRLAARRNAHNTPKGGQRKPPAPHRMNKGETRYRDHLDKLKLAGVIRSYQFEAVRLLLGANTTFLPDFFVVTADRLIEFHEVKGRKGQTFYAKEDAWLKLKTAASLYPFWTFRVAWPGEGGAWKTKEIDVAAMV